MGTRADFYTRDGQALTWQGSIAWDGYPSGIDKGLLAAKSEASFLTALGAFLESKQCARRPDDGWPWPWDDSRTTDYAYIFDGENVIAYSFGHGPFDPNAEEPEWDDEGKTTIFPNMKDKARVTDGGFILLSLPK